MSEYLVHWTTKEGFASIVRDGFFRPTKAARQVGRVDGDQECVPTIYGTDQVVCLTEMPIGNWIETVTSSRKDAKRRWGIAIPKSTLYAYGARPVLYIDSSSLLFSKCPACEKYRLSNFSYNSMPDWTHEREWRVKASPQLNKRIGLYHKQFTPPQSGSSCATHLWGDKVIPIHLPSPGRDALPDPPTFVLLVDRESDKETARCHPAVRRAISCCYAPILAYWNAYQESLGRAEVVSLEYARDSRDRDGLWNIEELIRSQACGGNRLVAALWEVATTETRCQVLKLIGEEPDGVYQYCRGADLWSVPEQPILSRKPTIGERIEGCAKAVKVLKLDVIRWVKKRYRTGGGP